MDLTTALQEHGLGITLSLSVMDLSTALKEHGQLEITLSLSMMDLNYNSLTGAWSGHNSFYFYDGS